MMDSRALLFSAVDGKFDSSYIQPLSKNPSLLYPELYNNKRIKTDVPVNNTKNISAVSVSSTDGVKRTNVAIPYTRTFVRDDVTSVPCKGDLVFVDSTCRVRSSLTEPQTVRLSTVSGVNSVLKNIKFGVNDHPLSPEMFADLPGVCQWTLDGICMVGDESNADQEHQSALLVCVQGVTTLKNSFHRPLASAERCYLLLCIIVDEHDLTKYHFEYRYATSKKIFNHRSTRMLDPLNFCLGGWKIGTIMDTNSGPGNHTILTVNTCIEWHGIRQIVRDNRGTALGSFFIENNDMDLSLIYIWPSRRLDKKGQREQLKSGDNRVDPSRKLERERTNESEDEGDESGEEDMEEYESEDEGDDGAEEEEEVDDGAEEEEEDEEGEVDDEGGNDDEVEGEVDDEVKEVEGEEVTEVTEVDDKIVVRGEYKLYIDNMNEIMSSYNKSLAGEINIVESFKHITDHRLKQSHTDIIRQIVPFKDTIVQIIKEISIPFYQKEKKSFNGKKREEVIEQMINKVWNVCKIDERYVNKNEVIELVKDTQKHSNQRDAFQELNDPKLEVLFATTFRDVITPNFIQQGVKRFNILEQESIYNGINDLISFVKNKDHIQIKAMPPRYATYLVGAEKDMSAQLGTERQVMYRISAKALAMNYLHARSNLVANVVEVNEEILDFVSLATLIIGGKSDKLGLSEEQISQIQQYITNASNELNKEQIVDKIFEYRTNPVVTLEIIEEPGILNKKYENMMNTIGLFILCREEIKAFVTPKSL